METVETDFDDGALSGLDHASAAPLQTLVRIDIASDDAPAAIDALVKRALEMDPWYPALRDAQIVHPALKVVGSKTKGEAA